MICITFSPVPQARPTTSICLCLLLRLAEHDFGSDLQTNNYSNIDGLVAYVLTATSVIISAPSADPLIASDEHLR